MTTDDEGLERDPQLGAWLARGYEKLPADKRVKVAIADLNADETVPPLSRKMIGYALGRRYGRNLFLLLGRRFPNHFGEHQLGAAEYAFERWGFWTVFFGRFIAQKLQESLGQSFVVDNRPSAGGNVAGELF